MYCIYLLSVGNKNLGYSNIKYGVARTVGVL